MDGRRPKPEALQMDQADPERVRLVSQDGETVHAAPEAVSDKPQFTTEQMARMLPESFQWNSATSPAAPLSTTNPYEHRSRFPSYLTDDLLHQLQAPSKTLPWWRLSMTRAKLAVCGMASVFFAIGIALAIYFITRTPIPTPPISPYQEACTVFCQGQLLATVQLSNVWPDSKTFVDMPLTIDPADAITAFQATFPDGNATTEQVSAFLKTYFLPAGSDTHTWVPTDYVWETPSLAVLQNDTLRDFAFAINDVWIVLGRQINESVRDYQQRYSLIWQPYPMIVPGGRFVESYYWDSYWVILGLIRSGMNNTAMGVSMNLLHLLDTFGFVPNGGRVYYSLPGRSQPPLLTDMVDELYTTTRNLTFLAHAYPSLTREYVWWMQSGEYGHAVSIAAGDGSGVSYVLNRYVTDQHLPRPESWREDIHTASLAGFTANSPGAQMLYSELAAAAETGWDFSSRWFADGENITTCDTSRVIPVDLNAILYSVEVNLAKFAGILWQTLTSHCGTGHHTHGTAGLDVNVDTETPFDVMPGEACDAVSHMSHGDSFHCAALLEHPLCQAASDTAPAPSLSTCVRLVADSLADDAERYATAAELRKEAINALMWDESTQQWHDLHILPGALQQTEPTSDPNARIPDKHGQLVAPSVLGKYRTRTDLKLGDTVVMANTTSMSNFVPLWAHAYDMTNETRIKGVVSALNTSGLIQIAGMATTTANTSQQWDFPNGWSPLQHMLILGLNDTGVPEAVSLARELARRWVLTNYVAYNITGQMHEKYDVTAIGSTGAGGEYIPQVGFGWTNGVALDLMLRYDFASLD